MSKNKEIVSFVENEEKLIKKIKINQRQRVRTLLVFLIMFNLFLLTALTYFCFAFNSVALSIVCLLIFCLVVWRSCVTFLKGSVDIQISLYTDLLVINSYRGKTFVQLKYLYGAKSKKPLYQLIFKKPSNTILLTERNESVRRILISFIDEDVNDLCDEMLLLAIKERKLNNIQKD